MRCRKGDTCYVSHPKNVENTGRIVEIFAEADWGDGPNGIVRGHFWHCRAPSLVTFDGVFDELKFEDWQLTPIARPGLVEETMFVLKEWA